MTETHPRRKTLGIIVRHDGVYMFVGVSKGRLQKNVSSQFLGRHTLECMSRNKFLAVSNTEDVSCEGLAHDGWAYIRSKTTTCRAKANRETEVSAVSDDGRAA